LTCCNRFLLAFRLFMNRWLPSLRFEVPFGVTNCFGFL
jgi:hypothetical protein